MGWTPAPHLLEALGSLGTPMRVGHRVQPTFLGSSPGTSGEPTRVGHLPQPISLERAHVGCTPPATHVSLGSSGKSLGRLGPPRGLDTAAHVSGELWGVSGKLR